MASRDAGRVPRGARGARGARRSTGSTWSRRRSTGRSRRSSTRTWSWPSWSSPTTTSSTAATSRSISRILTLLATQAPVATDLRLIAALLHVMKNIERMGDQCVNIAKLIPIAGHEPPADERMIREPRDDGQRRPAPRSGRRGGVRASATSRLARDLVRQDDVVDNLNKECFQLALEIGDDADTPRVGDDDDARRARHRADRRQRRRHRRAGRIRRDRDCSGSSRMPHIPRCPSSSRSRRRKVQH